MRAPSAPGPTNLTCSVVIPAYNVAPYIAETIESVLAQTYPVLEIIVVNDGSTDGTEDAIAPYSGRIIYMVQANRGVASARNKGLMVASGDLIGLIDADDVWMPQRLERCVALLLTRPQVGFVTTDAWLLEEGTTGQRRFYDHELTKDFPEQDQLARMIHSNVFYTSVVARRELYDRHGCFDESLRRSEDYDMWLRFLMGGEQGAQIPEPLAYYRKRSDSLSADGSAESAAHRAVLEKHLRRLVVLVRSGFGPYAWEVALQCAERGDSRSACQFFWLAAHDRDLPKLSRARAVGRAVVAMAAGFQRHRESISHKSSL